MVEGGKKVWYFADGYLPEPKKSDKMESHEALMIFNTSPEAVESIIDVYFSDRDPIKNIKITIPPERIISLRLDKPEDLNGAVIPMLTQYALRVSSSRPVVCQFGRLDTTQEAMAYYVGVGYAE
ncbi:MAG: hypothetical protein IKC05_07370 [Lentisphaeria bacterium]|nr:hypothetical protein [Lentisphaerota bacterium]MBR2911414.1 hypothetical protein [Lentisphaeria bacterium]